MKIAIDFDEVIADFLPALLNYYYKQTGKSYRKEDFKEYKFWPVWRTTREEVIRIVDEFHNLHRIDEVNPRKSNRIN